MAASSKQKSPYITGTVCAGKEKNFPGQSHENRSSVKLGGTATTVGQQQQVHGSQEQSQDVPVLQYVTPCHMTTAVNSLWPCHPTAASGSVFKVSEVPLARCLWKYGALYGLQYSAF